MHNTTLIRSSIQKEIIPRNINFTDLSLLWAQYSITFMQSWNQKQKANPRRI